MKSRYWLGLISFIALMFCAPIAWADVPKKIECSLDYQTLVSGKTRPPTLLRTTLAVEIRLKEEVGDTRLFEALLHLTTTLSEITLTVRYWQQGHQISPAHTSIRFVDLITYQTTQIEAALLKGSISAIFPSSGTLGTEDIQSASLHCKELS